MLRDKWGCSVAGGQDKLEGKMFRVSHMGYVDPMDTIGLMAAIEYALIECGVKGMEIGKGVAVAVNIIKGDLIRRPQAAKCGKSTLWDCYGPICP